MYDKTRTVLIHIDVAYQIVKSYGDCDCEPQELSEEEIIEIISDLQFFGKLFPNVFEEDIFIYEGEEIPNFADYTNPVSVMESMEALGTSK